MLLRETERYDFEIHKIEERWSEAVRERNAMRKSIKSQKTIFVESAMKLRN